MNSNIEIAKKMLKAGESKDMTTLRSFLASNYTLKDPMLSLNGADEAIKFMEDCPTVCTFENTEFVADGDKVVMTGDMVATAPVKFKLRVCDVMKFQNGKITSEEMFYDPSQIPEEAKSAEQKGASGKKKAA